jgi:signal peptidase I
MASTETETKGFGAARDGGNGAGPRGHDHDMDQIFGGTSTAGHDARSERSGADPGPDPTTAQATPVEDEPHVAHTARAGDGGDDGRDGGDGDQPAGGGDGDEAGEADTARKRRRPLRSAVEWGLVIGGALLVALVIRTFLLQAFWIPTASMVPTLHEGDRVLVNKLSYDLHDVNRGDIVVFERPEASEDDHPEDDIKDLIKRVVALPGETIEAREGSVYIDGRLLDEPYLPEGTTTDMLPETEIPEGHVFVMGDNRGNSQDSRVFGAIDDDLIVGRAFMRIFPLGDIGGL